MPDRKVTFWRSAARSETGRNHIPKLADKRQQDALQRALESSELRRAASTDAAFCIVEGVVRKSHRVTDYRLIEFNARFAAHIQGGNPLGKTICELFPSINETFINILAATDRTRLPQSFEGAISSLDPRCFCFSAIPVGKLLLHRVGMLFYVVKAKHEIEAALEAVTVRLNKAAAENEAIAETLYSERQRAHVTLNSIGDAVICTGVGGDITYLNAVAERLTGWSSTDAIGKQLGTVFDTVESECREAIPNPMGPAVAEIEIAVFPPLSVLVPRDASDLFIEDSCTPIRDRTGQVTGAVMVFHDMSVTRGLSSQLTFQASHDILTSLPNRHCLSDRLRQAIAGVRGHQTTLAVLSLDLDRFKHINDSLGYAIGDRLLKLTAARLTACLRESDTVSRQGGDEFLILLVDIDGHMDAAIYAEKMLKALRTPCTFDEHELHVSGSIGIAVCPQDGCDVEVLLSNADRAMYEAKERGRNNYQFYRKDLNANASARQSLESSLRHALEHQQLELNYQPIMDLRSGVITGSESLLRWRHPQHGLLTPSAFMDIAEEAGIIVPIGHWVLRTTCLQARAWQAAGLPPLRYAVNVSAVELRSKDFVAGVAEIINETCIEPSSIELELTETFLMQDWRSTALVLKSLKKLDVHLALDDFGTGYSSLSYLRRFPIDTLKIDRSFVTDLPTNSDDASVVGAVINMGKSLNMRVIAEGVETDEQHACLKAQQCPEAQGFLFGRPLEARTFEQMIREQYSNAVQ